MSHSKYTFTFEERVEHYQGVYNAMMLEFRHIKRFKDFFREEKKHRFFDHIGTVHSLFRKNFDEIDKRIFKMDISFMTLCVLFSNDLYYNRLNDTHLYKFIKLFTEMGMEHENGTAYFDFNIKKFMRKNFHQTVQEAISEETEDISRNRMKIFFFSSGTRVPTIFPSILDSSLENDRKRLLNDSSESEPSKKRPSGYSIGKGSIPNLFGAINAIVQQVSLEGGLKSDPRIEEISSSPLKSSLFSKAISSTLMSKSNTHSLESSLFVRPKTLLSISDASAPVSQSAVMHPVLDAVASADVSESTTVSPTLEDIVLAHVPEATVMPPISEATILASVSEDAVVAPISEAAVVASVSEAAVVASVSEAAVVAPISAPELYNLSAIRDKWIELEMKVKQEETELARLNARLNEKKTPISRLMELMKSM
jgi:hypothetical protein